MKKSVRVLAVLVVLLTLMPFTASAKQPETKTWTKHYRDLYLSGADLELLATGSTDGSCREAATPF